MRRRLRIPEIMVTLLVGCQDRSFPLLVPPNPHHDTGAGSPWDTSSGDSSEDTDTSEAEPDPAWFEATACETNQLVYTGLDESCVFNSFAWVSPDDGGIVVRAAMTEPGGPTACELFSTDPSPYEAQPLIVNIWAGEGNTLGPYEVEMEAAKEEAPPPPGDPNEPDGLGADAVVRLSTGVRLRSESAGEVFQILHYGETDPLVVDERFQATFDDGSVLEAGSWVACHCPGLVAFGSE